MPRQPRFVLVGHPQHVIIRGNNRDPIFYSEDDHRFYLERLIEACEKHECLVHAYVLMTNHVHLLITPNKEDGISKTIQMLGRYYVQYFNYTHGRTGTLWEGRYKAALIDSEKYALTCYRYIELNPVRANMVGHPSEYTWSSYRYNAVGKYDKLISHHALYNALGRDDESRRIAYRELFSGCIDEVTLIKIQEMTNKCWVLGGDCFKESIAKKINRQIEPLNRGGDRRSAKFSEIK